MQEEIRVMERLPKIASLDFQHNRHMDVKRAYRRSEFHSTASWKLKRKPADQKTAPICTCRLLADLFADSGGKRRQNAENRSGNRLSC
jgi:hypothetical protein